MVVKDYPMNNKTINLLIFLYTVSYLPDLWKSGKILSIYSKIKEYVGTLSSLTA